MSLVSALFDRLGAGTIVTVVEKFIERSGIGAFLPIIESTLVTEAASQGEPVVDRAIHLQASFITAQCAKVGLDPVAMLARQDAFDKEAAEWAFELATGQKPSVVSGG